MISVAEQFTALRDTLGSILGIFALYRWLRTLLAKVTGRPPPADATSLTPSAFARFTGQPHVLPDGRPAPPRPSKTPFIFFILAAFGLPYLMGKLIRSLARSQDERLHEQQLQQGLLVGPDGHLLPNDQQPLHPSQLDFYRLLYDYPPPSPAGVAPAEPPTPGLDLVVKKGDPVAVLSRLDPLGQPSDWWQCRTRDRRVGYLPSPYLELVVRKPRELTLTQNGTSPDGSRLNTLSTVGAEELVQREAEKEGEREKEKVPIRRRTDALYE